MDAGGPLSRLLPHLLLSPMVSVSSTKVSGVSSTWCSPIHLPWALAFSFMVRPLLCHLLKPHLSNQYQEPRHTTSVTYWSFHDCMLTSPCDSPRTRKQKIHLNPQEAPKVDGSFPPVAILSNPCPKMTREATSFMCARTSEVQSWGYGKGLGAVTPRK